MTKDIHYYMALDYPFLVRHMKDDGEYWFAEIPLLPGCMTHAEKLEDLPAMLREAKEGWLLVALEYGDVIAEPEAASTAA